VEPVFTDYLWHFIAGLGFAGSGAYAQQFCEHIGHRVMLAFLMVFAETVLVVNFVG
jgi:hypothetical protein